MILNCKYSLIIKVCIIHLLFLNNAWAQLTLGPSRDETAPLITSEFTTFNPGSGYCRFIPSEEYTITLSSGCQTFLLYIPLLLPGYAEVSCGAQVNVTVDYNQNHYIYFSTVGNGDVLRIITNGSLPVELVSFTVVFNNGKVQLNWQTATEVNNYGFEVERNQNNSWQKIGFVQGHGNSNSIKDYSFTDKPTGGSNFKYRLKQIDIDGKYEYSTVVEAILDVPAEFSVKQNFPNPFNPTTKIEFSIPSDNNVEIKVFNVLGMEVATLLNGYKQAGTHNVEFNANNFSSGIYFYKVVSGNYSEIKKMFLLR